MNKNIYTIFDTAAACGEIPFVLRTDGEALRQFGDLCVREGSRIADNPEDFNLMKLGVYDDCTMEIFPEIPRCLATGLEMVAKARQIAPGSLKENGDATISDGA